MTGTGTAGTEMTVLAYTLVCAAMLLVWAGRTWRLWRTGLAARRGWLVPLGVLALYSGLLLDLQALIGGGVALALIGEFLPDVTRRRRARPAPELRSFPRWEAASEPERPDMELHLEETGARVLNVGAAPLRLHGWSPAGQNGWLLLRRDDGSGAPLTVLHKGEWARLSPWPIPNRGVRVWYVREDAPDTQWLFRADWNGVNLGQNRRELN